MRSFTDACMESVDSTGSFVLSTEPGLIPVHVIVSESGSTSRSIRGHGGTSRTGVLEKSHRATETGNTF